MQYYGFHCCLQWLSYHEFVNSLFTASRWELSSSAKHTLILKLLCGWSCTWRGLTMFWLCPLPVWLAHSESQKEGQSRHFKVHDSIPGPQHEDAGAVQPRKNRMWPPVCSLWRVCPLVITETVAPHRISIAKLMRCLRGPLLPSPLIPLNWFVSGRPRSSSVR